MGMRSNPESDESRGSAGLRPGVLTAWCHSLFALLFLVAGAFAADAQDNGTISGVVVSSWDGTPLAGATVTVRGTTLATQSGADGRFELKNVPAGDQVLRFSKSSYASAAVTDVRVLPGQTTTVNGNLRPEFYEMEEYEVTAEEFTQQTEQILIERQQSFAALPADNERLVQRNLLRPASPFVAAVFARQVDQHLPHEARSGGKEMPAVFQSHLTGVN